jgi:hypothetical protein
VESPSQTDTVKTATVTATDQIPMLRRGAGWVAARKRVPTSARAVFGYYADSGVFDAGSLRLKRRVDGAVEGMVRDAFREVEEAVAEEFGHSYVSFEYDTKLLLPAKLTLGYLYRDIDEREYHEAEQITRLIVEALLDGDMRDALNDDEYDDFVVDFETTTDERGRIAELAHEVLRARVESQFERFPDEVRAAYDEGVAISEAHQDDDGRFRSLMSRARDGDGAALASIEETYKFAEFESEPGLFTEDELALPYLKTQYDRVGVIYDAMMDMYRGAGFEISIPFQRSIVLAIIGAQIWLDDLDDYEDDLADGQLTPVTAEYLLAGSGAEAKAAVVEISESYLDRAREQATAADSALTGIATEYIDRSGNPEKLPTEAPAAFP